MRGRLGQRPPEFVARDLFRAPGEAVRLVHDDQIPAGIRQRLDAIAVVLSHSFGRPLMRLSRGFTESIEHTT